MKNIFKATNRKCKICEYCEISLLGWIFGSRLCEGCRTASICEKYYPHVYKFDREGKISPKGSLHTNYEELREVRIT